MKYENIPYRIWKGGVLTVSPAYKRVMARVGRMMKEGAAVRFTHHLEPKELMPCEWRGKSKVYDRVTVEVLND